MNRILGIDPGKTGALALHVESEPSVVHAMPDSPIGIVKLLEELKPEYCYLEHIHSIPGDGGKSMFAFGTNFGMLQGALAALRIPYEFVTPQKWQKIFDSAQKGDTKEKSLQMARRLYPDIDLHRKGDNGKSDALLIGLWGVRQQKGDK